MHKCHFGGWVWILSWLWSPTILYGSLWNIKYFVPRGTQVFSLFSHF
uniref:Uncharacterized protein n=1 Tax=Rhizophora mucronata TaxID=61149 RepID=A0A2P2PUI6_RHIMU